MAILVSRVLVKEEGGCSACPKDPCRAPEKYVYKVIVSSNPHQSSSIRFCRDCFRDLGQVIIRALASRK